jgi:acetate kinase
MIVLALNSGSSSFKFGLFRVKAEHVEELSATTVAYTSTAEAVANVKEFLTKPGVPAPDAVGHRIVHGGPALRQHCMLDTLVVQQLEAAVAFAPLHMPAAFAFIRFAQEHLPGLPQVACFDTCFHAGIPDVARVLPIPKELRSAGIQRYGFHGLSYESIVHALGSDLPNRIVIAHLGNGASVTAVKNGKSIDTSMGLTPTGGVIMGTRSGDLDPGVLLYLMREMKFDAAKLADLVDHKSGLLAISGISSDMRCLHEAATDNTDARLAIQMFCYSVGKQIAAMIAALNGIDLLVFTGGIGENDAQVRAGICSHLLWIGVCLDEGRNQSAANPVNSDKSRCIVRVIASQEDEQIARHTSAMAG